MVDFEVIVADKETGQLAVSRNAIDVIRQVTAQKKAAEKTEKEMKAALMKAMEDNHIDSIKTDDLTVTYIEEHDSIRLDQKELKEKHLRVYEDCLHIVNTKASVRITLK